TGGKPEVTDGSSTEAKEVALPRLGQRSDRDSPGAGVLGLPCRCQGGRSRVSRAAGAGRRIPSENPAPNPKPKGDMTMRFMMLVKSAENSGPPPKELMDAIARISEEATKAGTMV